MSLVEKVRAITKEQMLELARTIEGELKTEATNYKKSNRVHTGKAAASIHIEEEDEFKVFVGAHVGSDWNDGGLHLYYMTQGNSGNGSDGRIHPTRKKALKLKDGSIRKSVSPYEGRDFIRTVANRHR